MPARILKDCSASLMDTPASRSMPHETLSFRPAPRGTRLCPDRRHLPGPSGGCLVPVSSAKTVHHFEANRAGARTILRQKYHRAAVLLTEGTLESALVSEGFWLRR